MVSEDHIAELNRLLGQADLREDALRKAGNEWKDRALVAEGRLGRAKAAAAELEANHHIEWPRAFHRLVAALTDEGDTEGDTE